MPDAAGVTAPEVRVHRSPIKALRLFDADRFRRLDEAASLGPLVALRMGPVKVWTTTDPQVARTIVLPPVRARRAATSSGSFLRATRPRAPR
jgi:hypothetical protein